MTNEPSPRPWRVVAYADSLQCDIYDANGTPVCTMGNFSDPQSDAALIVDAVNLKARIDEAMADESGYLYPVVLDGKPMVCVTPPPSEAEEGRMHREYETSLLVDRERFRRCYYEAEERNDRLRDIVRRLADLSGSLLANYEYRYSEDRNSMEFVGSARRFIAEARRAAIGEDKP